jgi:imidazolonepropionase-like amidohydrolase
MGREVFWGKIGIDGKNISYVEKDSARNNNSMREDCELIDASGYTVMPGLIDCHVHLVSPWNTKMHEPYWKLISSPSSKVLTAAANANRTLASGFTTVRNCGGTSWYLPEDVHVRDSIAADMLIGPRVWSSAGGITMTGGHGDRAYPAYMIQHPEIGCGVQPADGADACRHAVRERIKYGADFIKIYTTGGVSTPGDGPHSQDFTMDELRAIIDEAHSHEKRVGTHAQGLAGIRKAVLAGVDTVEHGSFLDTETADEMAHRGVFLVTTLRVFEEILKRGASYPNPDALRKAKMVCDAQRNALILAKDRGVTLAFGTDASQSIRNGDNAAELMELMTCGFSPMDILLMATRDAARAIGLQGKIGTVTEGQLADLILLQKNPLEDIGVLSERANIRCVMYEGNAKILRDGQGNEYQSACFPADAIRSILKLKA